jgi:toxin ParE1/3/4
MAKISRTSEAERWLKDIYDYIAPYNRHAAAEVIAGIYEKVQMLVKFSEIGYRLVRTDGNMDILGVFHDALDIQRYLL